MSSIIIKESQLVKLMETAMDLDIYVQPVDLPIPGRNDDFLDSLEQIKSKIGELVSMASSGEKIGEEQKRKIYRLVDLFNKTYNDIKFIDKSEVVPIFQKN